MRAAFDSLTASRAAFTTPSRVISLVAANPQEPFASVRTPTPYDSESFTPLTAPIPRADILATVAADPRVGVRRACVSRCPNRFERELIGERVALHAQYRRLGNE